MAATMAGIAARGREAAIFVPMYSIRDFFCSAGIFGDRAGNGQSTLVNDPAFFNIHREEFLSRYHQRSNVESTFSMIKRKFGDSARSKLDVAMKNEVSAKLVCHNICRVNQEARELGIDPGFGIEKLQTA